MNFVGYDYRKERLEPALFDRETDQDPVEGDSDY